MEMRNESPGSRLGYREVGTGKLESELVQLLGAVT